MVCRIKVKSLRQEREREDKDQSQNLPSEACSVEADVVEEEAANDLSVIEEEPIVRRESLGNSELFERAIATDKKDDQPSLQSIAPLVEPSGKVEIIIDTTSTE
jgi:flagellar motor protein MotB